MAISLKRYEPQVGVSAQTGTRPISGGLASTMIQAAGVEDQLIGDAIGALGDVAVDFFEHKAKGEVAKYEAYKQEWANELEVKKQQGLLDGGLSATDLYDKVVVPEQIAFEKWVSDQGFSSLARQQIDLDVTNFGKKVNASERLNLIQLQIEEGNFNRMEEAEVLENKAYQAQKDMELLEPSSEEYKIAENIYNQNTQLAEDIYEDLKRTTKVGAIDEIRSKRRYNRYNLQVATSTEALAFGQITPQQFSEDVNKTRELIRNDTVLNDTQKSTLDSQLTYKIAGAANNLAKQAQTVEQNLTKKINSEDGITTQDIEATKAVYGDTLGDKINQIIKSSFQEIAISDLNVKQLNEDLQLLIESPDTYEEFIDKAVKIGGKYAELAREVAAITISEMTNEDATISYKKINPRFGLSLTDDFKIKTAPYNGWVKGIHLEIIEFTKVMPLGDGEEKQRFINKNENMMKQLIDFYYINPNPSAEQLQELRTNMFGQLASEIANRTTVIAAPKLDITADNKDPLGIM